MATVLTAKATALAEVQAIPPNVIAFIEQIFTDLINFLKTGCGPTPTPPATALHAASLPTRAALVHTRRFTRRRLAGTGYEQYEDAVVAGVPVVARKTTAAEMETMYGETATKP